MFKEIAIIGGGPAGLAAAKALSEEPVKFKTIDVFERREKLGGIWYYGGDKNSCKPHVPSLDPHNGETILKPLGTDRFFSPMYNCLETNIIARLMEYRNFSFPSDVPMYPSRDQVWEYLAKYAKTIPQDVNINLCSNIVSATKVDGVWELVIEDSNTGKTNTRRYDALVVANGHFEVPFIPSVTGLHEWGQKAPGTITHAKYFDKAVDFKDKNVLVVGNSASGIDISTQLTVSAKQVYVSLKDRQNYKPIEGHLAKYVGMVAKYDYDDNRTIHTDLGETISDIDYVVFCTGYLYSVPFLKSYPSIVTDGSQINDLYNQVFYINDPSLTFIALIKNVIPLPCAEVQVALVARYYSGRFKLPSKEDMRTSYKEELEEKGGGKSFHNFAFPLDLEYCRKLWAILKESGTDSEGFLPTVWDELKIDDRSKTASRKEERVRKVVKFANELRKQHKEFELLDQ